MYLEHFQLDLLPFGNTPDPFFFFLGGKHREALAAMTFAVTTGKGLMLLTAPSGCGKTTLSRMLSYHLPEGTQVTFLVLHQASSGDILDRVAHDLGVESSRFSGLRIAKEIEEQLLMLEGQGRRFVVVIDEAQALSDNLFDEILLLSNLETERSKLVQILLMGRRRLVDLVNMPALKPLKQRVAMIRHLSPLNEAQTKAYIEHRLKTAGGDSGLISPPAAHLVFRLTGGVPRLINKLCDAAFLSAYLAGAPRVDIPWVREGAMEIQMLDGMTDLALSSGSPRTDSSPFLDEESDQVSSTPDVPAGRTPEEHRTSMVEPADFDLNPGKGTGSVSDEPNSKDFSAVSNSREKPWSLPPETKRKQARKVRLWPLGFVGLMVAAVAVGGALSIRDMKSGDQLPHVAGSRSVPWSLRRSIQLPTSNQVAPPTSVPRKPSSQATGASPVEEPKTPTMISGAGALAHINPFIPGEHQNPVALVAPTRTPDGRPLPSSLELPADRMHYPFSIQVGSFLTRIGAENAVREVRHYKVDAYWTKVAREHSGPVYRVFTGRFETRKLASDQWATLQIPGSLVVETPFSLLVGVFDSPEQANARREELADHGLSSYIQEFSDQRIAVLIGGFSSREEIERTLPVLGDQAMHFLVVRR